MSNELKQLLVHADASLQFAQRLEFAGRLAARHGAGITALYASPSASEAIPAASGMGPGLAVRRENVQDTELARARSLFEQLKPVGVPAAWAEIHEFPLVPAFAEQALYADLLVLGQHGPGEGWSTLMPADFPETVIALSGRPAVVLPYTSAKPGLPGNVVIAWKPTRGAARAVTAALPILRNANAVHILSWGADAAAGIGAGPSIVSYLKAHGIQATWQQEETEPENLGDLLLSRAFDLQADLLVMGCYGRSRAHEWVLGGASRTVLKSMTLPVLMAH
ncbi:MULTISPECIES: universal stress protein [unclassified Polaromonas]|uniref:universal stress protein n=1 Tax=unclassified Polaromonas TaxID=2638319 RepID=UPI000F0731CA|nr:MULTISPECIES: universal stress protein [unclassified Polaromonas]AYQ29510.1 universal stress protein [Polaromonas sp. SP1]QGJ19375.1 universal stress protein [Polaromonas sp. Pch-P]